MKCGGKCVEGRAASSAAAQATALAAGRRVGRFRPAVGVQRSAMEAGVLRVVVLVALFLLLTADYSTLLSQLLAVLGAPAGPAFDTKPAETALAAEHESWELYPSSTRAKLLSTIKNSCLPKLICEMNAMPSKEKLTESEKSLLNLIRDTSISVTAEVTSRYHFAAHMGQLIAGVDGAGCHNFYPSCPFPGLTALQMIKSARSKR